MLMGECHPQKYLNNCFQMQSFIYVSYPEIWLRIKFKTSTVKGGQHELLCNMSIQGNL